MLSHGLRCTGIYVSISLEESPCPKILTKAPITVVDEIEITFVTGIAHNCNVDRDRQAHYQWSCEISSLEDYVEAVGKRAMTSI